MARLDRRVTLLGLAAMSGAGFAAAACRPSPADARPDPLQGGARSDLYACEGCEATSERNPADLPATRQLAGPDEPGERMILTGRVLAAERGAPASSVVVYAHHTNSRGLYADGSSETEWSRRHGRLRGWVRTGPDGVYRFDTIKPAPYPAGDLPAHVHIFIQEPGRPPYYIDDVVFEGETLVDDAYRARQELRGGSGIIRLQRDAAGTWLARRDIRLERHPTA